MSCSYFCILSLVYVGFTLADHSSPISSVLARSGGVKRRSRNLDLALELQMLEVSIADQDKKITDLDTQIKDLEKKITDLETQLKDATEEPVKNFLSSRIMLACTDSSAIIHDRGTILHDRSTILDNRSKILEMIATRLDRSSGSAATEVSSPSDDLQVRFGAQH
jgi:uncharacterized coiled-coil protein SlyX